MIDETHDPAARSWVESAQNEGCDFPIQNLPLCVFSTADRGARGGVGIGDQILDMQELVALNLLEGEARVAAEAAAGPALNALMAMPSSATHALRSAVFALLRSDETRLGSRGERVLVPMAEATFHLPARIGGYTDFLSSRHHTERNSRLRGAKDPLPPAFFSLPVAYNGRVSSLSVSGTDVIRPCGQYRSKAGEVVFGPTAALDFELEMGAFVRQGNAIGEPIPVKRAAEHLFGLTVFNDWSAKDIQWWETLLGPFLGKSFMTSLSPWVVTAEALAPFRMSAAVRSPGDPPLLDYLRDEADQAQGAFSVRMEAWIRTEGMRRAGVPATRLSCAKFQDIYWTFAQMLAHHTSNGCPLQPGDFIGSGTVSGEDEASRACMTEIGLAGSRPVPVGNGEERAWLEDGDELVLRAKAERPGYVSIGFGECAGRILPARRVD